MGARKCNFLLSNWLFLMGYQTGRLNVYRYKSTMVASCCNNFEFEIPTNFRDFGPLGMDWPVRSASTHHASSMNPMTNFRTSIDLSVWNAMISCRGWIKAESVNVIPVSASLLTYTSWWRWFSTCIQKIIKQWRVLVDNQLLHLLIKG